MKILNICDSDWANFSYDNMMALRSVGLDCQGVKLKDHIFEYDTELEIVSLETMKDRIKESDVIQFFHDNIHLFRTLIPAMEGKKIIAYHTSSYYRKNYDVVNSAMNPHVWKSVNAMPEFMGLGSKHEVYMVGAVDTEKIKPVEIPIHKPYVFAHYPSNPRVKGTDRITQLFNIIDGVDFVCSTEQVPYKKQLKRIAGCDVYVEMLTQVDSGGMPYGNFGITALEAAAMGKIVLTNCKDIEIYKAHYGSPFFFHAENEKEFTDKIDYLKYLTVDGLYQTQVLCMELLTANHSYKATGEYFIKNILNGQGTV